MTQSEIPRPKSFWHSCDREIRANGPSSFTAQDGDKWTCTCGKTYEHLCDEAEGCSWLPVESQEDSRV